MPRHRRVRKRSLKAFSEQSYVEEGFDLTNRQPRPPVEFPIAEYMMPDRNRRSKVVYAE